MKRQTAIGSALFSIITLVFFAMYVNQQLASLSPTAWFDFLTAEKPNVLGTTQTELIVTEVVDGDTIKLSTGETLRYIGIDAPEMKRGQQSQECYAAEATAENTRLVLGKSVRLEKDTSETDRYGRLLRYVYVDETLVNESLVRNGFAIAKRYRPDTGRAEQLEQAQQLAELEAAGIWTSCQ